MKLQHILMTYSTRALCPASAFAHCEPGYAQQALGPFSMRLVSILLFSALCGCSSHGAPSVYSLPASQASARVSLVTQLGPTAFPFGQGYVEVMAFEPNCAVSPFGLRLASIEDPPNAESRSASPPLLMATDKPVVLTLVHYRRGWMSTSGCPYSVQFVPAPGFEYEVAYEYDGWCRARVRRKTLVPPASDWSGEPSYSRPEGLVCLDQNTKERIRRP